MITDPRLATSRSLALAMAAACFTIPARAGAQNQDDTRAPVLPELAVSTGVALPSGAVEQDLDLKRRVRALAPQEVEPGVRLFSSVGLSFRALYAPGWMADPLRDDGMCDLAQDVGVEPCSVRSTRIGAALTVHAMPQATIDPWASVGFTRERVRFRAQLPRTVDDPNDNPGPWEVGYSLIGWSLPELRAGANVRVVGPFRLGAMAAATWGKYERALARCGDFLPCADVTFDPRKTHGWYGLGLRASVAWPATP